jgi:hypothetical protein
MHDFREAVDRDVNASINILAAWLGRGARQSLGKPSRPRWFVCGATVRPEQSKSRLGRCYEAETQTVMFGNLAP